MAVPKKRTNNKRTPRTIIIASKDSFRAVRSLHWTQEKATTSYGMAKKEEMLALEFRPNKSLKSVMMSQTSLIHE